jgi:hypothetical protein
MKTETLSIDLLTFNADTQSRCKIDQDVVEDYAEKIRESDEWPFPPLDVFSDGSDYWPADGFHRGLGAVQAKRASVPCNVHTGTAKDARIFGMTANDRHGLRMTRADKRRCVEWMLKEFPKMSQREIAEKTGVSKRTVQMIVADQNPVSMTGKAKPSKRDGQAQIAPPTTDQGVKQDDEPPQDDLDFVEPTGDEIEAATSEPAAPAPKPDKPKPGVKALEGREAEAFDARKQIAGMYKTIAQWFVPIDKIREGFPSKLGDQVQKQMAAVYESLQKWEKVTK